MVIICKWIFWSKWSGIMIWPFILVKKNNPILINHERIHYKQCMELFIIGFYLWYLWELLLYGYYNNRFEIEAYDNQNNLDYLKSRKKYNYVKIRRNNK